MRATDIRQKTDAELETELETKYKDLLNLRFRWETRQMNNKHEITKVQKDIARIRTVLTERALGIR